MCSSRSPPGLSKPPTPDTTPQVCTLHLAESSTPRLQYTPRGSPLEACLGPEGTRIPGRSRTVLPVQVQPYLLAGALVLIQPPMGSPLGDNPILQEVQENGSLSVLAENDHPQELHLEPEALLGSVQEVTSAPSEVEADTSPPPEASTHKDFDALHQNAKIKWLVAHFHLNDSPLLQRDSHLRKEVIRVLLQFADVISIRGYVKLT